MEWTERTAKHDALIFQDVQDIWKVPNKKIYEN
jgi:hypothetical protein